MIAQELTLDPLGIGYAAMTDAEVEQSLTAITRTRLVKTEIGNGLILSTLGLTAGNALLDVIHTQADFRYVKPLVEQGRLDISDALVRATLDSLVGTVLTAEQAAALKAIAEQPCSRAEELGLTVNDITIKAARS